MTVQQAADAQKLRQVTIRYGLFDFLPRVL
jgi:hypothetical protein